MRKFPLFLAFGVDVKPFLTCVLLALALALPAAPAAAQEGPADRYYDCVAEAAWTLRDSPSIYRAARFAGEAQACSRTYAMEMGSTTRARRFVECVEYALKTYEGDGAEDVLAFTLLFCRTSYTGWELGKLPPPPPKDPTVSGARSASRAHSCLRRDRCGRRSRGRALRRT